MTRYQISLHKPSYHYIDITVRIESRGLSEIYIQLPAWRPGRYELANFAQNIRKWEAFDENGNKLKSLKFKKDKWVIHAENGCKEFIIKYDYYSNVLDAGSTYFDENQLYVNPVNCMIYVPDRMDEPCEIQILDLPENYKIASSLKFDSKRKATAKNYDTFVDSPFMASPGFKTGEYTVGDYNFSVSILGNVKPDWGRMTKDFKSFSAKQIELFGELPVSDYLFLCQVPDYKFYHGVEHLASNVICVGPAQNFKDDDFYNDYLGISSHELFHTWNVKSIRPKEMYPYDYTKENYTPLNYVTEGVTSYYGDLMLFRSQVHNWETYFARAAKTIERHLHNYGKLYQTLDEASMDAWLDGYKVGAPERKISFYQKGMIVAWMLDLQIRQDSGNAHGLDSVMKVLYHEYAKKDRGYMETDYLNIISSLAGKDYKSFFEKYIWGLEDVGAALNEALKYIGCELTTRPNALHYEGKFGFRLLEMEPVNRNVITHIAPDSPADKAALSVGDKVIAVNGISIDTNLNEVLREHEDQPIELFFARKGRLSSTVLTQTKERYYPVYQVIKLAKATDSQKLNFALWAHQEF